jgi:hypothetical protein
MEWESVEPPLDEYYDQACQAEYDRISNERGWVNEGCSDVHNPVAVGFAAGS